MKSVFALAAMVAAGSIVATPQAHAIGCISGGAAGAVAGHVAGHHAVLGAMAGCAVGHHAAVQRKRAAAAQSAQPATPAPTVSQ